MARIGERGDPYLTSHFYVEIQGIEQASFAECSGLSIETEVFEYQEGGLNEYVHRLPGRSKVSNVTLKRGITESTELWDWYRDVVQGKIERKNLSIVQYDLEGNEVMRWAFIDAYPVKWSGPSFKADANAITIETLELAHRGMDLS
jgi:phage tail-like protein